MVDTQHERGLDIQKQGFNRMLQDLYWQDWGFSHFAFIKYYQVTTKNTLKNNLIIQLDKIWSNFGSDKDYWHLKSSLIKF